MAIPNNTVAIGGTSKKSQYDALYDNAILCDIGGTPGGAQTVPGLKTFIDGINIDRVYSNIKHAIGMGHADVESWDSEFFALEGQKSAISIGSTGAINLVWNAYYDDSWKFKSSDTATRLALGGSTLSMYVVGAGTIGDPITWEKQFVVEKDVIGIGGYAGGNNRDSYIYMSSNSYIFLDDSANSLHFAINGTDLFRITHTSILPVGTTKTIDAGDAAQAFDDMWADDFQNVADFPCFDNQDDIAAICQIAGSGEIDPRSGCEIIDDSTLPEWLLTRSKDGKKIVKDPDNKPYVALKAMAGLLIGGIKQLAKEMQILKDEIILLKG